jgi:hypothetical protein
LDINLEPPLSLSVPAPGVEGACSEIRGAKMYIERRDGLEFFNVSLVLRSPFGIAEFHHPLA